MISKERLQELEQVANEVCFLDLQAMMLELIAEVHVLNKKSKKYDLLKKAYQNCVNERGLLEEQADWLAAQHWPSCPNRIIQASCIVEHCDELCHTKCWRDAAKNVVIH